MAEQQPKSVEELEAGLSELIKENRIPRLFDGREGSTEVIWCVVPPIGKESDPWRYILGGRFHALTPIQAEQIGKRIEELSPA